jgi:hypothetical protein
MQPGNPHGATLRTRILQGITLAVCLLLFRIAAGALRNTSVRMWQAFLGLGAMTLGGASGAVVYYATDSLRAQGGWRKTTANVLSLLTYCLVALAVIITAAALDS